MTQADAHGLSHGLGVPVINTAINADRIPSASLQGAFQSLTEPPETLGWQPEPELTGNTAIINPHHPLLSNLLLEPSKEQFTVTFVLQSKPALMKPSFRKKTMHRSGGAHL